MVVVDSSPETRPSARSNTLRVSGPGSGLGSVQPLLGRPSSQVLAGLREHHTVLRIFFVSPDEGHSRAQWTALLFNILAIQLVTCLVFFQVLKKNHRSRRGRLPPDPS